MNKQCFVILPIAVFGFTGFAVQPVFANSLSSRQVEEVVTRLEGVMNTSAQAAKNPQLPNVQMTTCRVHLDLNSQSQPIFLYQEQALIDRLNQPYRQRLLHIGLSETGDRIESRSFRLANPQAWQGLCNKPETQRLIPKTEVGQAVCTVFLKPQGSNYIGETPPEGCPANYRGAVKITNQIILNSHGMDTTDKGFDANGNQVWGARNETYQFRRVN